MWPTEDSTMKSGPSMPPMVRALAGDSTMTSALPTAHPAGQRSERFTEGMTTSECGAAAPAVKSGVLDRDPRRTVPQTA